MPEIGLKQEIKNKKEIIINWISATKFNIKELEESINKIIEPSPFGEPIIEEIEEDEDEKEKQRREEIKKGKQKATVEEVNEEDYINLYEELEREQEIEIIKDKNELSKIEQAIKENEKFRQEILNKNFENLEGLIRFKNEELEKLNNPDLIKFMETEDRQLLLKTNEKNTTEIIEIINELEFKGIGNLLIDGLGEVIEEFTSFASLSSSYKSTAKKWWNWENSEETKKREEKERLEELTKAQKRDELWETFSKRFFGNEIDKLNKNDENKIKKLETNIGNFYDLSEGKIKIHNKNFLDFIGKETLRGKIEKEIEREINDLELLYVQSLLLRSWILDLDQQFLKLNNSKTTLIEKLEEQIKDLIKEKIKREEAIFKQQTEYFKYSIKEAKEKIDVSIHPEIINFEQRIKELKNILKNYTENSEFEETYFDQMEKITSETTKNIRDFAGIAGTARKTDLFLKFSSIGLSAVSVIPFIGSVTSATKVGVEVANLISETTDDNYTDRTLFEYRKQAILYKLSLLPQKALYNALSECFNWYLNLLIPKIHAQLIENSFQIQNIQTNANKYFIMENDKKLITDGNNEDLNENTQLVIRGNIQMMATVGNKFSEIVEEKNRKIFEEKRRLIETKEQAKLKENELKEQARLEKERLEEQARLEKERLEKELGGQIETLEVEKKRIETKLQEDLLNLEKTKNTVINQKEDERKEAIREKDRFINDIVEKNAKGELISGMVFDKLREEKNKDLEQKNGELKELRNEIADLRRKYYEDIRSAEKTKSDQYKERIKNLKENHKEELTKHKQELEEKETKHKREIENLENSHKKDIEHVEKMNSIIKGTDEDYLEKGRIEIEKEDKAFYTDVVQTAQIGKLKTDQTILINEIKKLTENLERKDEILEEAKEDIIKLEKQAEELKKIKEYLGEWDYIKEELEKKNINYLELNPKEIKEHLERIKHTWEDNGKFNEKDKKQKEDIKIKNQIIENLHKKIEDLEQEINLKTKKENIRSYANITKTAINSFLPDAFSKPVDFMFTVVTENKYSNKKFYYEGIFITVGIIITLFFVYLLKRIKKFFFPTIINELEAKIRIQKEKIKDLEDLKNKK